MKKAISILVAAAALAFATSAMAAVGGTTTTSRNSNSTFPTSAASMPSFRVGDTLTIEATDLASGNELTVISYKDGAAEKNDSTVQYINQYTLSDTSKSFDFVIRDEATGVYHLQLNDNANPVDFYYTIGKVTAELVTQANDASNSDAYYAKEYDGTWSVGFVGKITVDGGVPSDFAVNPGFHMTEGAKEQTYHLNSAPADGDYEVNGTSTYLYGFTMYKITAGHQGLIEADAVSE